MTQYQERHDMPWMTEEFIARIERNRQRLLRLLEALHTERDPDCTTWEQWTVPALEGRRLAVEGCRQHDILISQR